MSDRELAERVAALAADGTTIANISREIARLFAEDVEAEEAVRQLREQFGGDEAVELLVTAVFQSVRAESGRKIDEHGFMAAASKNIADGMKASGAATLGDFGEQAAFECIDKAGRDYGLSAEVAREIFFREMAGGGLDG